MRVLSEGATGKNQLLALSETFDLECVKVYTRSSSSASAFVSFAEELLSCVVIVAEAISEACNSDILVTTTLQKNLL